MFGHDGSLIALLGARRKILVYDNEGTFLEEMSFADMGMAPDRFHIMDVSSGTFLFYALPPDFLGDDKNRIVLATFRNGQFEYDLSYQKTEPTSRRMFFSGGTFLLYDSTRLWVHPIFEHGNTIYDPLTGARLGGAEDVTDRLPKPLISQWRVGTSVMSFYTSGKDRLKHERDALLHCGQ